jgi:hypothetical protein
LPSRRDLSSAELPVDFSPLAREELPRGPLLCRARAGLTLHRGRPGSARPRAGRPLLVSEGWSEPVAETRADPALPVRARLRRQPRGARGAARHRGGPRLQAARLLAPTRPASGALTSALRVRPPRWQGQRGAARCGATTSEDALALSIGPGPAHLTVERSRVRCRRRARVRAGCDVGDGSRGITSACECVHTRLRFRARAQRALPPTWRRWARAER